MKKLVTCAFLILSLILAAGSSRAGDKLISEANEYFKPIPAQPPTLKNNPATPARVELGKLLYFEPRLSRSCLISCNTCHNVGLGGADFQETSTGHGWRQGPRNAPTVLNSVYNVAQFWDGRAKDLADQAKGPVQASVEMNNTPDAVVKTLKSMPGYIELFQKAFPGEKDPVTFDNMARAIEVFEATLITPDSRFDKFLKGEASALNEQEKRGLTAFIEKGCADCHGGINMGGDDYYTFGVVKSPSLGISGGDKGRYKVTKAAKDEFAFKSPSLRNIELTPPYFHSGKVWSLKAAVMTMSSAQLESVLSKKEIDDVVAFLKTTTGKQPRIEHPVFPKPTEATPHPKLD